MIALGLKMARDVSMTAIIPKKECRDISLIGSSWLDWRLLLRNTLGSKTRGVDLAYLSLGGPMGVFEMIDMVGIDVVYYVHL